MERESLTYHNFSFLGSISYKIRVSEEKKGCNYYPFGLKHSKYNQIRKILAIKGIATNPKVKAVPVTKENVKYKYKFNNAEWQDEFDLNTYDLGARQMDPALGRFMSIDPLAELTNYQTPYAVADNNPVFYIDAYGLGSKPPKWLQKVKDFFTGGRKSTWKRGRKVGRNKRTVRTHFSKSKKNTQNTAGSEFGSKQSVANNFSFDIKGLELNQTGFNSDIELKEISLPKTNIHIPKPPDPWWKSYQNIPINRTIDINYMNNPTTGLTTMLNKFKSGRELGAVLKTLNSDPKLKLYIKIAATNKHGNSINTSFSINQTQSLINYLTSEGVSIKRIKRVTVKNASTNRRTYINY